MMKIDNICEENLEPITSINKPEYLNDMLNLKRFPNYQSRIAPISHDLVYKMGNEVIVHDTYKISGQLYMQIKQVYSLLPEQPKDYEVKNES